MKPNNKPQVVAVIGPTGSGKTKLGIEIAKKYNAVIISADSRQIYKGLDVGTNKEGVPNEYLGESARTINNIPQLLIDIVEPEIKFSLYDWLLVARRLVRLVIKQGKLPIIVGGTGLYVSALLSNWELGAASPALRKEIEKKTLEELQEMADGLPNELNESDYKNPRRLVRLVEKSLIHNEPKLPALDLNYLVIANSVDRKDLFDKSDERFKRLFKDIIEEAKKFNLAWLYSLGLDYKFAVKAIRKELPKDQILDQYNVEAHRYIRRQQTWWQHHEKVTYVNSKEEALSLVGKFLRTSRKLVE